MPPRARFHEPMTQGAQPQPEPEELPTMPGMYVERPGVYLRAEDVSFYLARLAERYHGEGRVALLEAAQAFASATVDEQDEEELTDAPALAEEAWAPPIHERLAPPEEIELVARVEIYPNADGKWETRGCDIHGNIIAGGPSDFSREAAEANARVRWPDRDMFELPDPTGDSVWNEERSQSTQSLGVLSGRPRTSPRRMFVTQVERPESARPV